MIGCPVSWKCFSACLFFELSQHPTCPHVAHMRRCTHVSPLALHSVHPVSAGATFFSWLRCLHAATGGRSWRGSGSHRVAAAASIRIDALMARETPAGVCAQ